LGGPFLIFYRSRVCGVTSGMFTAQSSDTTRNLTWRSKTMSKRIAFCADGTWDTADKHTNVYKLYKSMPVTSDQMPFYDDGVGASGNPILKVVGGAFGTGLWSKIKEG